MEKRKMKFLSKIFITNTSIGVIGGLILTILPLDSETRITILLVGIGSILSIALFAIYHISRPKIKRRVEKE
jgi:hypothetical protein